ncbi:MAG: hypothetical protein AB1765_02950 [Candidatus Hydrogenedentota bacterium]
MKLYKCSVIIFLSIFCLSGSIYSIDWKYKEDEYFYYSEKFSNNTIVVVNQKRIFPDKKNKYKTKVELINGVNLISARIIEPPLEKIYYYCILHKLPRPVIEKDKYVIFTNVKDLMVRGDVAANIGYVSVFGQRFPEGYFNYKTKLFFEENLLEIKFGNQPSYYHGPEKILFIYDYIPPQILFIETEYHKEKYKTSLRLNIIDKGIYIERGSGIKIKKRYYIIVGSEKENKTYKIYLKKDSDIFSQEISARRFRDKILTLLGSNIEDNAGNKLLIPKDLKIDILFSGALKCKILKRGEMLNKRQ